MKRLVKWSMVVFMLVSFAGCGSEQNEAIEAYKSEARYYYCLLYTSPSPRDTR